MEIARDPGAEIDSQALRIVGGQADHRGAGVDEEAHVAAVHLAVGDEVAARVGRERHARALAGLRGRLEVLAHLERLALAVDLQTGAARVGREQLHALRRCLPTASVRGCPRLTVTTALPRNRPITFTSVAAARRASRGDAQER
jgi:hypothetical protein